MDTDIAVAEIFKRPDLLTLAEIAAILVVAVLLVAAGQRALPWVGNRLHGQARLRLLAMVPVLRLLVIVGAFVAIVPLVIRPSLQNMVALLGTVGLAIGFALKDFASSLVAGVVAVAEMPYRNGDWVEIGGVYGEVRHVGMRTVTLVTPDDSVVTIPHARLWTDAIVNANDGGTRLQCVASFHLHPRHDAALVMRLLNDVALTSAYLHFDGPVLVVAEETPWGTKYRLKAYPTEARQQFRFVTDLTVRGKAALMQHGLAFAAAPAGATAASA